MRFLVNRTAGKQARVVDFNKNNDWAKFLNSEGITQITTNCKDKKTIGAARKFCKNLNDEKTKEKFTTLINNFRKSMRKAYNNPKSAKDDIEKLLSDMDQTIDSSYLELKNLKKNTDTIARSKGTGIKSAKRGRKVKITTSILNNIFGQKDEKGKATKVTASEIKNAKQNLKFEEEFLKNKCADFHQALYYHYANKDIKSLKELESRSIPSRKLMTEFKRLAFNTSRQNLIVILLLNVSKRQKIMKLNYKVRLQNYELKQQNYSKELTVKGQDRIA